MGFRRVPVLPRALDEWLLLCGTSLSHLMHEVIYIRVTTYSEKTGRGTKEHS
jgi:hypothetical protein